MYYVYMVKCSDNTIYTGYTNDLEKRVSTHNKGVGAKYTRGRTPVELCYFEEYENKIEAQNRERSIKKLNRKKKLELIGME